MRLGIESVTDVVRRGRLRWFGHLERKDETEWASSRCRHLTVDGQVCRGRGKKTWGECIERDLKDHGLERKMAKDRSVWRRCIHGNRPTCASTENGR
jgi:hypothetical protein